MLRRSLASLIAQTHRDWVAEVRNDAPDDPEPAALVGDLGDPRITCVTHARNLGAVATFNLCYTSGPEPYMALLEDDNAWEPDFLSRLLSELERHPEATLAWCNQSIDEEQPGGRVLPTGRSVRSDSAHEKPRLHTFGAISLAFGALHANGAMLLRRSPAPGYLTPAISFTGVEAYRERLFPGPMLYIPAPLARFTLTLQSARPIRDIEWPRLKTAFIATFMRAAGPSRDKDLWAHARNSTPSMAGSVIMAALADPACRRLLRHVTLSEWLRWLIGALRHPRMAAASLRCRRASWWNELADITAQRLRG
ncbi:MAG: glycosyltransferase [Opitutaceae bacterium]|nr:glycosyltransferase [Opitutaceae bacterium]